MIINININMENQENLILNEFNENDVIEKNNKINEIIIHELEYLYENSIDHMKKNSKIISDYYQKLIMLVNKENKSEEDLINMKTISELFTKECFKNGEKSGEKSGEESVEENVVNNVVNNVEESCEESCENYENYEEYEEDEEDENLLYVININDTPLFYENKYSDAKKKIKELARKILNLTDEIEDGYIKIIDEDEFHVMRRLNFIIFYSCYTYTKIKIHIVGKHQ